jgi:tetratricopeptide (TPR) repeat protein
LKGDFLSIPDMVNQAIEIERRALSIDPELADARMWLGSGLLRIGRTDEAIAEIREALRLDPDNGQAYQGLARAYWVGKGDFKAAIPLFDRAIALNPEAGYSYLQLALLLAWEGQLERAEDICRRAVELQEQYISGNLGLQIVGAHSRLGYVHYLKGEYDEALREYERELAFIGAGDHALRERTQLELNIKIGAVYLQQGRRDEAERHFGRALKSFDSRVANGADDSFTRYYVACLHALRGDRERALESLERVAKVNPELTAARARVDVDLASLRDEPRFQALLSAAP